MNIQSLVVVALRLLALDFLLRVAVQLTPQMLQLLKMDEQLGVAGDSRYRTTAWMALLALVVGAALLWFLAVPIARLVTRNVSQELSLGSLTLADCYSVVFIGIGLLYMVRCLPKVLSLANYFLTTPASERGGALNGASGYEVWEFTTLFGVGVLLFVMGRRWALVLASRK
jgi:hypothetical protein